MLTELFGSQLETIEAIVVALGTSFVGTGTVALIVKVALGKVTKNMTQKVLLAEQENKITSEQARKSVEAINLAQDGFSNQIIVMQQTIDKLIQNQSSTNKNVQQLLEEYKARDEQIKELIVQEFGEDLE
jgi:ABC-type glycerol-3-phosphate transport system substrate-binding protein